MMRTILKVLTVFALLTNAVLAQNSKSGTPPKGSKSQGDAHKNERAYDAPGQNKSKSAQKEPPSAPASAPASKSGSDSKPVAVPPAQPAKVPDKAKSPN